MYKNISDKWNENIYKNRQAVMNIYFDNELINPDYILDFKKGGDVFDEELILGSTPSQYIELQIHKSANVPIPKQIRIEYGILINHALTVAEVNSKLVGTLNGIPIRSVSANDSSFEIIPIGIYNVDDYNDEDDNVINIKALDNMIKFEFNYDGSELISQKGYATLGEVAQDICEKAGVELGSTSFLNSNKEVAVYDNQITAREYIGYIAESAGCFACSGRDGKIYFRSIGQDEVEIPIELFGEYKWGEEFKITKVAYEDGTRSFKFGDETRNALWINQENMYIVDEEQVENIYNKVKDLTINSFEGKTIIDPAIDIGDKIIIDGKSVIYQGEMSLAGRFIVDIKSKIDIKQKQETTVKRESQKVVNRRVQSRIDQVEGTITTLVEETSENSQKLTQVEQTLDSISQKVENIEDLTQTVEGIKTITLENCVEGDLLELHIFGNNTVFNYLYPSDDLFPDNDLYPYGDSRIEVINFPDNSEQGTRKVYELGVTELLRQNTEVCDEFILENGQAKVIRRVNKSGSTKAKEKTEGLGEIKIELKDGTNIITIQNYTAKLSAKFAFKNNYTDIFATKVEMNSSITQTAEEINLEVKKKVDENEIISKINQSAEQVSIQAEKISLSGKTLNLADNMAIVSNKFNVDKNGNMTCSNAKISGGYIGVPLRDRYDLGEANLGIEDTNGTMSTWVNGRGFHCITDYSVFHADCGSDPEISIASRNNVSSIKPTGITTPTLTQTSLEESKKNFEKLQNGLEIVKNTEIYKYNLKSQANGDKKHIGFVIGKNYKYSNEITALDNEGKEVGVDTYSMISVAYKAIQELLKKNEDLEKRVKELEGK